MKTLFKLIKLFALLACPLTTLAQQHPISVDEMIFDFDNEVRLKFRDQNPGGVRYTLVKSNDLQSWTLVNDPVVEVESTGKYDISSPLGAPVNRLFYRIDAERTTATLGFQMRQVQVDEGSGEQILIVSFVDENGAPLIYNGPVRYEWSGAVDLVSNLTGEVMAGGTTAEIPLTVGDNAGTEELNQLQLKLIVDENSGYEVDPATAITTLTIDENDNYWRGSFQTDAELIDLEIYIRHENGSLLVFLTDGTALLGAGALSVAAEKTVTDNRFHAVFPPVVIPMRDGNLVAPNTMLGLELDADDANAAAGESVSSKEFVGSGTMTISNTDKPHITTQVRGKFLLRKDPPLQPNDDLPLD